MLVVSIHAPTRGATQYGNVVSKYFSGFNPRTHTGCDVSRLDLLTSARRFQSTHPHGVRPTYSVLRLRFACFNPRTHTGCDRSERIICVSGKVSIHAPTRGATNYDIVLGDFNKVSIHAPTRGATQRSAVSGRGGWFQSTHPHGVRPNVLESAIH